MTDLVALEDLDGAPHAPVFPGEEPQTVKLTLEAGGAVAPHQHPDRQIVLYLVSGHLEVTVGDDSHEIRAGEVVRFDGDQYVSPEAVEDSVALLVLAERSDG